jgi:16S rRNA G966 N2-methylase RsmD
VERNRQALKVIAENLKRTCLSDRAQVVGSDVFKFLKGQFDEKFDLIYIAPPQYKDLWAKTLLALDGQEVLADGGLIVAQIHPKEFASLDLKSLRLADQRKYGSTLLCFYAQPETE